MRRHDPLRQKARRRLHRIVRYALAEALANIDPSMTQDNWSCLCPEASRCFTPQLARETLQQLLAKSEEPTPYRATDYHYLLLYDCLQGFCEGFNLISEEEPGALFDVGPCRLREIDFEALVAIYFWDTDFLADREVAEALGTQGREHLGLMDEAFAIAEGWTPHEDDLRLEPANESAWGEDDAEPLFRPESSRYPDWRDE